MILSDVYNHFNQKCTKATSLVRISNIFFDNQVQYSGEIYSLDISNCVINSAFLMLFTALEEFLEHAFICYMSGQPGLNNNHVISFVTPPSEEHAHKILKGRDKYPDFTNRDTILLLANNYFDNGGPFVALNNYSKDFEEIKKIRNAITHISEESKKKFFDMVRTKLGALPVACNTTMFLNMLNPEKNTSYFIYYRDCMKSVVYDIANPI